MTFLFLEGLWFPNPWGYLSTLRPVEPDTPHRLFYFIMGGWRAQLVFPTGSYKEGSDPQDEWTSHPEGRPFQGWLLKGWLTYVPFLAWSKTWDLKKNMLWYPCLGIVAISKGWYLDLEVRQSTASYGRAVCEVSTWKSLLKGEFLPCIGQDMSKQNGSWSLDFS